MPAHRQPAPADHHHRPHRRTNPRQPVDPRRRELAPLALAAALGALAFAGMTGAVVAGEMASRPAETTHADLATARWCTDTTTRPRTLDVTLRKG